MWFASPILEPLPPAPLNSVALVLCPLCGPLFGPLLLVLREALEIFFTQQHLRHTPWQANMHRHRAGGAASERPRVVRVSHVGQAFKLSR